MSFNLKRPEAEFKEFEPRLKSKPRLKYGLKPVFNAAQIH